MVTWPSGLRRRFAKPLYGVKPYPGFESLRHRHLTVLATTTHSQLDMRQILVSILVSFRRAMAFLGRLGIVIRPGVLVELAALIAGPFAAFPAAATLTFYDSQSSFDAAFPGDSHTDFSSLTGLTQPSGIYTFPGATAVVGEDKFTANQYLLALTPAAVGAPYAVTFLSSQSQGSEANFFRIGTPSANAFGFDFGSYGAFPLTVTLNTGESFQIEPYDTPQFIGFASSLGPITSIQLTGLFEQGQGAGTVIDLLDVSQSDATAPAQTPEPATWALMLSGLGMAGAGLRASRRQRGAA
jgi:hypothetical protein